MVYNVNRQENYNSTTINGKNVNNMKGFLFYFRKNLVEKGEQ